jgi:hypothetical protein
MQSKLHKLPKSYSKTAFAFEEDENKEILRLTKNELKICPDGHLYISIKTLTDAQ